MNNTHALVQALESYATFTVANPKQKYVILTVANGSYSVAKKLSGFAQLLKNIGAFLGLCTKYKEDLNTETLKNELYNLHTGPTLNSNTANHGLTILMKKLNVEGKASLHRQDSTIDLAEVSKKEIKEIKARVQKYKENARSGIDSNNAITQTYKAFKEATDNPYSSNDIRNFYNILDSMLKEAGY
jgi:hypothetical protein